MPVWCPTILQLVGQWGEGKGGGKGSFREGVRGVCKGRGKGRVGGDMQQTDGSDQRLRVRQGPYILKIRSSNDFSPDQTKWGRVFH